MSTRRYYIRQNGRDVAGPFDEAQVRSWIREGAVRSYMEISTDGVEWSFGVELPGLFPDADWSESRGADRLETSGRLS